jgi:Protein of unknown function (DUF1822)
MFTANELAIAFPHQICLELPVKLQEELWASEQKYSNDAARWRAYLNRLCLDTLLPYLQSELGLKATICDLPLANLASIWEMVNGTAINLGKTRTILVPSETDTDEFCVPQEWVDIPSWGAPYYLAVQINLEDNWLRVWGYATHQQLKTQGNFNKLTHSYSLDREDAIDNLNVLWVTLENCHEEIEPIAPFATLSLGEAEKLLQQLSCTSPYSPRLDVPFEQWGVLLANSAWRQNLYQQRLKNSQNDTTDRSSVENSVNLAQWFQDVFEAGWQPIEMLFTAKANPAFAYRNRALTLDISRGKLIDLGIQLAGHAVALVVTLKKEAEQTTHICLRIYPMGDRTHLPKGLKLSLLDDANLNVLEAEARDADNYIQLQFGANPGAHFSAKVSLADICITTEKFIIPFN